MCGGNQENHDTTSQAERLPPFFRAFVAVVDRQVVWVIEHQAGGLKTHSVLDPVSAILILVRSWSHSNFIA